MSIVSTCLLSALARYIWISFPSKIAPTPRAPACMYDASTAPFLVTFTSQCESSVFTACGDGRSETGLVPRSAGTGAPAGGNKELPTHACGVGFFTFSLPSGGGVLIHLNT